LAGTRPRFGCRGMIVLSVLVAFSAITITPLLISVVAILQVQGLLPLPAPKEDKSLARHHQ
jgi:hypothetical protein